MPWWKRTQERAEYARTSGDLLVNDPDGFPSDYAPVMWWHGLDTGGGSYPIGPNGPYAHGHGEHLPVVTRATALITGPLTSAPFEVANVDVGTNSTAPRWLTDPMLARPDERVGPSQAAATRLTRAAFWTEFLRGAIWHGVGAFVCVEDLAGAPVAGTLRVLNPRMLDTERVAGSLRWALGEPGATDRLVFDRDGRADIGGQAYRIVTLRNPHSPVDSDGRSKGVFELSPGAFKLSGQIESYASGTFRSGIPAGYLKSNQPNLSPTAAADLKSTWLSNHGGDRRSIAVLNATTEFVPMSISPVDAALGEVKRLAVADVAMAFGLDPMTLGAGLNNSATYSNLRDAWSNHRDFGLAPWRAALQDSLSVLLPLGREVRADLDGFANAPAGERYAAYQTAISAGVLTVNEAREKEGLPPMPEASGPRLVTNTEPDDEEQVS